MARRRYLKSRDAIGLGPRIVRININIDDYSVPPPANYRSPDFIYPHSPTCATGSLVSPPTGLHSFREMANVDLRVPSLFAVKDQVALVTGGGSGIGTMIATALVQNGAKVYISSRKEKQLKEVSKNTNPEPKLLSITNS